MVAKIYKFTYNKYLIKILIFVDIHLLIEDVRGFCTIWHPCHSTSLCKKTQKRYGLLLKIQN